MTRATPVLAPVGSSFEDRAYCRSRPKPGSVRGRLRLTAKVACDAVAIRPLRCGRAILAIAAAFILVNTAAAQPISVTDAFGRTVTVPAPPQRIVTIFSSNVELIAALGLTDRIVGIEAFTRYPPEVIGRPLVGGRLGFSVDAVIGLKPDLLVVTPAREAAHTLVDPMDRLGIPIVEILRNIRLLGRITGVPERGEAVTAKLEGRLADVAQRLKGREGPRAVMVRGRVGNGLLLVARPETYTGDAMVLAGGRFALE